jgi:hypothetical protein
MKPIAGQIHAGWPRTGIERSQKPAKSGSMLGIDPARIAAPKEPL